MEIVQGSGLWIFFFNKKRYKSFITTAVKQVSANWPTNKVLLAAWFCKYSQIPHLHIANGCFPATVAE